MNRIKVHVGVFGVFIIGLLGTVTSLWAQTEPNIYYYDITLRNILSPGISRRSMIVDHVVRAIRQKYQDAHYTKGDPCLDVRIILQDPESDSVEEVVDEDPFDIFEDPPTLRKAQIMFLSHVPIDDYMHGVEDDLCLESKKKFGYPEDQICRIDLNLYSKAAVDDTKIVFHGPGNIELNEDVVRKSGEKVTTKWIKMSSKHAFPVLTTACGQGVANRQFTEEGKSWLKKRQYDHEKHGMIFVVFPGKDENPPYYYGELKLQN